MLNIRKNGYYKDDVNLFTHKKEMVTNYGELAQVVCKVRRLLDRNGTREIRMIDAYFDIYNFMFKNYSINPNNYNYIKENTGIDLNKDYVLEMIRVRKEMLEGFEEHPYYKFNYELRMRPLEGTFSFAKDCLLFPKETIFNYFSKSKRDKQEIENFEQLKNLLWVFVEEAIKVQRNVA